MSCHEHVWTVLWFSSFLKSIELPANSEGDVRTLESLLLERSKAQQLDAMKTPSTTPTDMHGKSDLVNKHLKLRVSKLYRPLHHDIQNPQFVWFYNINIVLLINLHKVFITYTDYRYCLSIQHSVSNSVLAVGLVWEQRPPRASQSNLSWADSRISRERQDGKISSRSTCMLWIPIGYRNQSLVTEPMFDVVWLQPPAKHDHRYS